MGAAVVCRTRDSDNYSHRAEAVSAVGAGFARLARKTGGERSRDQDCANANPNCRARKKTEHVCPVDFKLVARDVPFQDEKVIVEARERDLMSIPTLIPIRREEGYHTHYLGRYGRDKQFLGFVVATLPEGRLPENWPEMKRWYAVLHLFDFSGQHLETRHVYAGTTADGEAQVTKRAMKALGNMLMDLGSWRYARTIKVKLFQTVIDGATFGLVDTTDPSEGYERVDLLPNDLVFFPPWTGEYDT